MVRIGILKTGNIATSLMVDLLLDERAEREDIEVRVFGSGAKLDEKQVELCNKLLEFEPDLIIYVTPNCSLSVPKKIIKKLCSFPLIVISDSPGIRVKEELEKLGVGYIFITSDSMIGARREFLDPIEMAIFNSDMLKILSVTGALRAVYEAIDRTISSLKEGKKNLPRIVFDKDGVMGYSGLKNPYALSKAIASHIIAEQAGKLSIEACFKTHNPEEYIIKSSSSHEMIRISSKLAEEAREIEKTNDSVLRNPHTKEGRILSKRKLLEKPK